MGLVSLEIPPARYDSVETTCLSTTHRSDVDDFDFHWPVVDNRSDNSGSGGGSSMKSNHHFRDQLSVVSGWFEQWNQCEQTVGLYSLLKRLGPVHARFLALVLEQNIAECLELQLQERHANDPGFIGSLSGESKETAVGQLLLHLPLLRPGNAEAKAQYLQLIPKVLAHSIRHGVHIEESRQLLSYSLIHPAVAPEDRAGLARWLRQLEERIALPPTPPADGFFGLWHHHRPGGSLPPGMALQPPVSSHPDGTQTLPMPHSRLRRSTSLTPPGTMPPSCSPSSSCGTLEQEVVNGHQHAPLSPQSSIASSGSGSEGHDKDAFSLDGTGMKDVPCWLKGLRLHKYAYIFKNMSYEEMMSITEEKLEQMNITKGARHKIVLSILKLCERQSNLRSLEKDLSEGEGTIRNALNELKAMLQTPIKAFSCLNVDSLPPPTSNGEAESSGSDPPSPPATDADGPAVPEGDLPGQLTRLLGKICASLLISNQEEDLNFFVMIVDKCLSHEAFTPVQKRRLFSWKQQVQKTCHPLPARRSIDTRQRNKWNGYHSGEVDAVVGGGSLRRRTPVQFQQPPPQRIALQRQGVGYIPNPRSSAVIKRPSLQDHMKPHVLIQRTNSAPVRPNPLPVSIFGKVSDGISGIDSTDPELNIRLESLCLSVTEHALGSFEGAVPLF